MITNESRFPRIGTKEEIATSHWVVLPLVLTLLLSGCAASSLMVGVREPDLAKIQIGDTRHQVERTVGKRQWRPGTANGLTYDIYQYESGRPAEPGAGAAALLVGVYSLGLTELPLRDARRHAPVKQVAVAYDEEDRVRLVSQPWQVPQGAVGPCRRMRALLPAESSVPTIARPSRTENATRAGSEVATLELNSGIRARINGRELEGRVAELPPGRHAVEFQTILGGSVMYGASLLHYDGSAEVELLPGRLYRLKNERFYGYPRQRADLFWIEDVHSGETLNCAWPTAS